MPDALLTVSLTAGISSLTAVVVVIITNALAQKREHEADWRKLKFSQYQEYILALSGIVEGRATPEAHRRYADAFNCMTLAASRSVLSALRAYQAEISYANTSRNREAQDRALNALFRAMRADVHPMLLGGDDEAVPDFMLLNAPEV